MAKLCLAELSPDAVQGECVQRILAALDVALAGERVVARGPIGPGDASEQSQAPPDAESGGSAEPNHGIGRPDSSLAVRPVYDGPSGIGRIDLLSRPGAGR